MELQAPPTPANDARKPVTSQRDKVLQLIDEDDVMEDTENASLIINCKPSTLRKWRVTGEGPDFFRVGKVVRYRRGDLRQWMETRRAKSTSQKVG